MWLLPLIRAVCKLLPGTSMILEKYCLQQQNSSTSSLKVHARYAPRGIIRESCTFGPLRTKKAPQEPQPEHSGKIEKFGSDYEYIIYIKLAWNEDTVPPQKQKQNLTRATSSIPASSSKQEGRYVLY